MKMAAWLSQCMSIEEGGEKSSSMRSEQSHTISYTIVAMAR